MIPEWFEMIDQNFQIGGRGWKEQQHFFGMSSQIPNIPHSPLGATFSPRFTTILTTNELSIAPPFPTQPHSHFIIVVRGCQYITQLLLFNLNLHAIIILNPVHPNKSPNFARFTDFIFSWIKSGIKEDKICFEALEIQTKQKTCWHLLYFITFMKAPWYWQKNDMGVNIYFMNSIPLSRSKPVKVIYWQPLIKGTSTTLIGISNRAVSKVDRRALLLA